MSKKEATVVVLTGTLFSRTLMTKLTPFQLCARAGSAMMFKCPMTLERVDKRWQEQNARKTKENKNENTENKDDGEDVKKVKKNVYLIEESRAHWRRHIAVGFVD